MKSQITQSMSRQQQHDQHCQLSHLSPVCVPAKLGKVRVQAAGGHKLCMRPTLDGAAAL